MYSPELFFRRPEFIYTLQQVIEFLGTFAFAISGIRHAAAKKFDWFGGFVCGIAVEMCIRDRSFSARTKEMKKYECHKYSSQIYNE